MNSDDKFDDRKIVELAIKNKNKCYCISVKIFSNITY